LIRVRANGTVVNRDSGQKNELWRQTSLG
jgi:hypothetical protein